MIITKADKDFVKKPDFKYRKFSVKVRDIHKTEKNNSIAINLFPFENKEKHPIYWSKKCWEEKRWFINNRGKRKGVLCFYQRFQHIHT